MTRVHISMLYVNSQYPQINSYLYVTNPHEIYLFRLRARLSFYALI